MKKGEYQIVFRIAAAIDLEQGIYYIDWSIDEEKQ